MGNLAKQDNETAAKKILERFLRAEGEKLNDIPYEENGPSLYEFISKGVKDKKCLDALKTLFGIFSAKIIK